MTINGHEGFEALETEKALLAVLMFGEGKGAGALSRIAQTDFTSQYNREIIRTIKQLEAQKLPHDVVAVGDRLPAYWDYLTDIGKSFWLPSQVDQYIARLKEATTRRALYALGKRVTEDAGHCDIAQTVDKLRIELTGLCTAEDDEESTTDVIWRVHDHYYSGRSHDYPRLGLPALDAVLGGLEPAGLYVVGARPSVGKSVFGMLAALRAGEQGKRTLIVNREMRKENVVTRMLANLSGLDLGRIRRGQLDMDEQMTLVSAYPTLVDMKIEIANKPRTPAQIREVAVRMLEKDGLDLLVVDYLQRMSSGRRTGNRTEEIGAISMGLKDIAVDLHIPVLLLSQLNRAAANSRPTMAHLRESGDIEQDADAVILLHQPDMDDVPAGRQEQYRYCEEHGGRYLEIIVDKNREGERAILPVMFEGAKMRYTAL